MSEASPRVAILMGVSGSGKTTVGRRLARALGWHFADGDDFHTPENIEKMRRGLPLDDCDRRPWLETLRGAIAIWQQDGPPTVLACSALKAKYREMLGVDRPGVLLAYLHGSFEAIAARLGDREGHFMGADLLQSQFEALEEPDDALWVEIDRPLEGIVAEIRACIETRGNERPGSGSME